MILECFLNTMFKSYMDIQQSNITRIRNFNSCQNFSVVIYYHEVCNVNETILAHSIIFESEGTLMII